jgi:hypothetical protein
MLCLCTGTAVEQTGSHLQGVGAELLAAAVPLDIVEFAVKNTELFCAVTKYKLLSTIRAALKKRILIVPHMIGISNNGDRHFETQGITCTCGEHQMKVPFISTHN